MTEHDTQYEHTSDVTPDVNAVFDNGYAEEVDGNVETMQDVNHCLPDYAQPDEESDYHCSL